MEKNEQETPWTLFSFNLVLQNLGYNILVASLCENNEGEHRTINEVKGDAPFIPKDPKSLLRWKPTVLLWIWMHAYNKQETTFF